MTFLNFWRPFFSHWLWILNFPQFSLKHYFSILFRQICYFPFDFVECTCFLHVLYVFFDSPLVWPWCIYALHDVLDAPGCGLLACIRSDILFTSDESLFIGTKEGQLLVYVVRKTSKDSAKFDTTVDRTHKSFSKKPITQLEVIPEYHILISLSGKSLFDRLWVVTLKGRYIN